MLLVSVYLVSILTLDLRLDLINIHMYTVLYKPYMCLALCSMFIIMYMFNLLYV